MHDSLVYSNIHILRCPSCSGALVAASGNLSCARCNKSFRNVDGVIDMHSGVEPPWWNHIPRESMPSLLSEAGQCGWRKSLEKAFKELDPYVLEYASLESRGDWVQILDLSDNAKVLDIGAGWGAVTCAIARQVGSVVACDMNLETLRFVSLRAAQEKIPNIQGLRISSLDHARLPFHGASFDAVVLNGVLEWVGSERLEISPDRLQKDVLKEIYRVLNPGGKLYLAIENRWGYSTFLGAPDHSGLRYTNLLPRKLADWVCRRNGMTAGYRTYTHGLPVLRRFLKAAGFSEVEAYVPLPEYRNPFELVPLRGMRALLQFIDCSQSSRRQKWLLGWLARLRLLSLVANDYSIVAKKTL